MAPDEAFSEYPTWRAKGFEEMAENGAAFLSVVARFGIVFFKPQEQTRIIR
jgi:leucyl aminopeptidase (aminopeptidase T)